MTLLELLSISLADKASSARRSERSDRFITVSDAACRPCQAEERAIAKLAFAMHAARMDTGRCGESRIYAYLRQARPRVGVSTQHKRRTTGPPAPTRGRAWARSYLLSRKLNSGRPCVKDASEPVTEGGGASRGSKHRRPRGKGRFSLRYVCRYTLAFSFLDYEKSISRSDNCHLRFPFSRCV